MPDESSLSSSRPRPARFLSLAAGLGACACASGLAGWADALRVGAGATPPLSARELAALAFRGAWPLLAALAPAALLVWILSARRSGARRPGASAAGTGSVLAGEAIVGFVAALAVLEAGRFDVKVGWIAGALLVGALAGAAAGRAISRLGGGEHAPANGRMAVWTAAIGALAWAPMMLASPAQPAPAGGTAPAAGERRNVVLVVVDALRADHLGAYGYDRPTSPVLDALAASGTRFDDVVAPSSWTLPAMASIFTSEPPGRHGTVHRGDPLPEEVPPLAERLREAGYATAGFAPNPWLKRVFGFDRGFDLYYDIDRLGLARLLEGVKLKNFALRRLGRIRVEPELVAKAPDLVRRGLTWLAGRPAGQPFFLYLHLMDVHSPYDPPPPFHGRFCTGHRFALPDHLLESRFRSKKLGGDPAILDHVVEMYDESILSLDTSIGDLLEGLRSLGLSESTLLVVTSDHGEEFLDHGDTMHGRSLYQEVIRVPMIAGGAGVDPGHVVADRVTTLDLAPTLLEVAGASVPEGADGASLARTLSGAGVPERHHPVGSQLLHSGRALTASFAGHRKVILSRPAAGEPGSVSIQAFDLAADPAEQRDLEAENAPAAAGLQALAIGMEELWGIPGARSARAGERIDKETLEQLEALGYLN